MVTEKLGRATLTGNNVTHISSAPLSSQRVPLGIPIQIIKGLLTWRWGTPGSWGNLPGHIISHMVTPSIHLSCKRDKNERWYEQAGYPAEADYLTDLGSPALPRSSSVLLFPLPIISRALSLSRFLPNLHSKETGLCRPGREPLHSLLLQKTS